MSSNLQTVVVLVYAINFHVFSLIFFLQLSITGTGLRKGGQAYMWPNSQKKKLN